MKIKTIAALLVMVVAIVLVAAFTQGHSTPVAARTICVVASARGDFLKIVRSDPRYLLLKADPIGKAGAVRITATGTTKELAQTNLDTAIRSLVIWGEAWQEKGISKEERDVICFSGAVQDYDPNGEPGRRWKAFKNVFRRLWATLTP
jgi:hypothetical protein